MLKFLTGAEDKGPLSEGLRGELTGRPAAHLSSISGVCQCRQSLLPVRHRLPWLSSQQLGNILTPGCLPRQGLLSHCPSVHLSSDFTLASLPCRHVLRPQTTSAASKHRALAPMRLQAAKPAPGARLDVSTVPVHYLATAFASSNSPLADCYSSPICDYLA